MTEELYEMYTAILTAKVRSGCRRPVAVEIVGTIGHIGVIEIVCSIIVNLVVTINTP